MLKVGEFLVDAGDSDGEINNELREMEIVVKDYEGNLHHVVGDSIMYDWSEGQLILELHSEVEDGQ